LFAAKPLAFAKPAESKDEDGGDDEDANYEDDENKPEIKTTIVANQKSPYTKVFDKRVGKFRLRKPIDKSLNGDLSIEYAETDGKKVYLLVLRGVGKSLFVGNLLANSRVRKVEERASKN